MKDELKKLLEHSLEYAKELLNETGECYPFAAYADRKGVVHPLEMEVDKNNIPQAGKVTETLRKYCETESFEKRMTAYCLAYEVAVQFTETEKGDAIAFELIDSEQNHKEIIYLPFKIKPKDTWETDNEDFERAIFDGVFAVK